jgi:hypothetical protein
MLKDQTLITLFHRNFKIHDELGVHRNLQNGGNVTKFLDEIEGTGENTLGEGLGMKYMQKILDLRDPGLRVETGREGERAPPP